MWYSVIAVFMLGVGAGAGIKGWQLDALQTKYDAFVALTDQAGKAAQIRADALAAEQLRIKEVSDHEYQTTITSLNADVKRLRSTRARSGYVPAASADSKRPGVACFDRAELEQTIRRLDDGLSELIAEGDAGTVALKVAQSWAAGISRNTSPGNPATVQH